MTQDTEDVVARLAAWSNDPDDEPPIVLMMAAKSAIQSLSDRIDGLRCAGNALAETVKMSKAALVASLTKRELEILMADLHAWNVAALHQEGIAP